MSSGATIIRHKIDKRWWRFVVIAGRPLDPSGEVLSMVREEGVDLLLVDGDVDDEALSSDLTAKLADAPDLAWRAMDLPPLNGLPPCAVVIGRHDTLARFARSVTPAMNAPDVLEGTYPLLPDPTEIAPFPEAATADPFGQNAQRLHEAWAMTAHFAGTILRRAHAKGLAVSLPAPPTGAQFLSMQPWRHVAEMTRTDEDAWIKAGEASKDWTPNPLDGLNVIQRCLVAADALAPAADDDEMWQSLAALLEMLGYTLVSAHAKVEEIGNLGFYIGIGEFVANLHASNTLHGDLHPGNFGMNGREVVAFDADSACTLTRPLTAAERAADLANLKLNCQFEQWEAVKVGYGRLAPESAVAIFESL
jgi:hypothetical protein